MTDASPATGHGSAPTDQRSLPQLLSELTTELTTLIRKEAELAKAETKEELSKFGRAASMLSATGVAAFMALLLLSFAAAWGLAEIMAPGWAFLIIAVIYGIAAVILGMQGRKKLQDVNPVPEQTVETLKEDVEWAKARKS
jgi:hypothetical protein